MNRAALVILDEIAKALSVLKAEAIRQRQHVKTINKNVPKIKTAISEYFDYMRENIYVNRLRGRNTYEMAENLTDWEAMTEYGRSLLSAKLADLLSLIHI